MNLGEIKERVWQWLDEDADDPQRYPAADVTEYVNDGIQHLATRAGFLVATTTITQVPYVIFYDLPTDFVQVQRVFRDESATEVAEKLYPFSYRELDAGDGTFNVVNQRWEESSSDRSRWYSVFGLGELMLWQPATAAGETYTVTYRQEPGETNVSSDSDTPSIPIEYHEALVDYVVGRALLAEGDIDEAREAFERYQGRWMTSDKRQSSLGRTWRQGHLPPSDGDSMRARLGARRFDRGHG